MLEERCGHKIAARVEIAISGSTLEENDERNCPVRN
jgi:hypothetical protein